MLVRELASPADLALCRQMIRQGSKSFHLASLLLPSSHREHARALYGFCRMADDLVDQADAPHIAVEELMRRLDGIYAGAPCDNATDRAFADVAHRFSIPRAIPEALIEGFAWDAEGRRYDTLSDVTAYAVRVAGTVGVMMSLIMGERRPHVLARAIDLGVAMQFSNIARDVEDDARMGRVYLPERLLKRTDSSADQVLASPEAGSSAATWLVDEAEQFYERSAAGIALLPRSCRASINAARLLYREIGLTAKAQGHRGRAVVPLLRKLSLVAQAIAQVPVLDRHSESACLPEGQLLIDAVASAPPPRKAPSGFSEKFDFVVQLFQSLEGRKP